MAALIIAVWSRNTLGVKRTMPISRGPEDADLSVHMKTYAYLESIGLLVTIYLHKISFSLYIYIYTVYIYIYIYVCKYRYMTVCVLLWY